MVDAFQRWEIMIADSLKKCSPFVEQSGHGQFALSNGTDCLVTARMDEGWLLLDAPLRTSKKSGATFSKGVWEPLQGTLAKAPLWKRGRVWELLQWNANCTGGSKFTLLPDEQSINLRAEIPLDEEGGLTGRIHQACAGFKTALERLHGGKTKDYQADPHPVIFAADPVQDTGCDLLHLCHETEWPFTERSAGIFVVNLDVPDGFYQATIEKRMGQIHVWVELVACESLPQPCQQALGVLLLTTSGIVRMARATAGERDGHQMVTRFEVVFASSPCVAELTHALSALLVACRLCGREAKVLQQDTVVAREYLRSQGTTGE